METTLPTAFTDSLRTLLGDGEARALCDALQGEPPASIRMNRLKTALVPQGEPVPWCPEGTYLPHRPTFTFDPMLHAGGYYVQEASSMFVAYALRSHMPQYPLMVLDLCAAPGGKSTLLRSILPDGSLLVANEVVRSRVQVLAENLAKWGHPGVVVTNNDPADFAPLAGMFDVILADVPCSGEGMFRRDPASVGEWSPAAVDACVERQRRIVDAIWPCLKPGGLFIYSTCTYNPHEDEEQVRRMRDELGAEVLPVASVPAEWGITGNLLPGEDFPVYRFLPHRTRGEGFFLALMRKETDAEDVSDHDAAAFEETRNRGQKNRQAEIGFDIDIAGNKISLAGYYNRTVDAYRLSRDYERFTFNYTSIGALEGCLIPVEDRAFSVDRNTGIVTVTDVTGAHAPEILDHSERNRFNQTTYASNTANPITRYGLEWVIDFRRINPINTNIRLDGSFYGYRSVDENIEAYSYDGNGADGQPYKYVGYFVGGRSQSNGRESRQLSTNLTITTHIPKVRMIVSLRLEATLLRYTRFLSEQSGGVRSHVLTNREDILSVTDASVYDGNGYAVVYPEYYTTYDDPYTLRNFHDDLVWARENGMSDMASDLARLAISNSMDYFYNKEYLTPYFSMNFSVTKEIGDLASISFYANNFFNNFGQIRSTRTGNYVSASDYITNFYYGLTLRFKF